MDIYKEIYEIFDDFDLDEPVKNDTQLIANGFIDSLRIVYIISELEDRFTIQISIEQVTMENFCSIDRIAALIGDILRTSEPGEN